MKKTNQTNKSEKLHNKLVSMSLIGALLGGTFAPTAVSAWTARKPKEIKTDIGVTNALKDLTGYSLRYGDTLWGVSRASGFTINTIADYFGINNPNKIYAGDLLRVDSVRDDKDSEEGYYTVVSGDTLSGIAKKFNVSLSQLIEWNNIENKDLIFPGESFQVKESASNNKPGNDNQSTPDNPGESEDKPVTPDSPTTPEDKPDTPENPEKPTEKPDTPSEGEGENEEEKPALPDDSTDDSDAEKDEVVTKEIVEFEDVNFETEQINDDTLDFGIEVVETEGAVGVNKVSYEVTITNGEETNRKLIKTETVSEPVNKVVRVGTKDVIQTKELTEFKDIGFDVERIEDDSLAIGEEVVKTEGVVGKTKETYEITIVNGEETNKELVNSEVVSEPVNKVVHVGTKLAETTTTVSEYEDVDFDTEYVEDDSLEKGKEVVINKGSTGRIRKQYKVTSVGGEVTNKELIESKTVVAPINRVIHVGTGKNVEEQDKEQIITDYELTDIEFGVERVEDNTIEKGKEVVKNEGSLGQERKTYKVTMVNGKEVSRELVGTEVVSQPVNKVIHVGTKPVESFKDVYEFEELDYEVEYIEDDTIEVGKEVVKNEGSKGQVRKKYTVTIVDGKEISRELVETKSVSSPINKVIHVGTKPIKTTKEVTEFEDIDFEIEYIEDDTLIKGEEVVQQEGQIGKKKNVYEVTMTSGVETDRKLINSEIVSAPVNKIIRVGTIVEEVKEVIEKEVVKSQVQEVEDSSLATGHSVTKQQAANGLIERTYRVTTHDGKVVDKELIKTETTKEVKDKITHIGTGAKEFITKEETFNPGNEIQEMDDWYEDEEVVIEGTDGVISHKYQTIVVDGETVDLVSESSTVISEGEKTIIMVGTKKRPAEVPMTEHGKYMVESGWELEDFRYDGNKITGFSDSGQAKIRDLNGPSFVVLPDQDKYGNKYEVVANSAFDYGISGVKFYRVEMPNTIKTIESGAFRNARLQQVVFSNQLETIGNEAFVGSSFDSGLSEHKLPASLKTIGTNAFLNSGLKKISLPKGITTIQSGAFAGNAITTVDVPNSATNISKDAFDKTVEITGNTDAVK